MAKPRDQDMVAREITQFSDDDSSSSIVVPLSLDEDSSHSGSGRGSRPRRASRKNELQGIDELANDGDVFLDGLSSHRSSKLGVQLPPRVAVSGAMTPALQTPSRPASVPIQPSTPSASEASGATPTGRQRRMSNLPPLELPTVSPVVNALQSDPPSTPDSSKPLVARAASPGVKRATLAATQTNIGRAITPPTTPGSAQSHILPFQILTEPLSAERLREVINPFTLHFKDRDLDDPFCCDRLPWHYTALESAFKKDYLFRSLLSSRISFIIGTALFAIMGVIQLVRELGFGGDVSVPKGSWIPFLFMALLGAVHLAVTFHRNFPRFMQFTISSAVTLVAIATTIQRAQTKDSGPSPGLVVIIGCCYLQSSLLFYNALPLCTAICIIFQLYLFLQGEESALQQFAAGVTVHVANIMGAVGWFAFERRIRRNFYQSELIGEQHTEIENEEHRQMQILNHVFPADVVARIEALEHGTFLCEKHENVTILFADIVGFTTFSQNVTPERLASLLNNLFLRFDALTQVNKLEKIKTIGDCYMVAGGLNKRKAALKHKHHGCILMAEMALSMLNEIQYFNDDNGTQLRMRIGFHTGTVLAGVIGLKRFCYDLYGEDVNIAAKMESEGEAGKIMVSEDSFQQLKEGYEFQPNKTLDLGAVGRVVRRPSVETFFLTNRRPDFAWSIDSPAPGPNQQNGPPTRRRTLMHTSSTPALFGGLHDFPRSAPSMAATDPAGLPTLTGTGKTPPARTISLNRKGEDAEQTRLEQRLNRRRSVVAADQGMQKEEPAPALIKQPNALKRGELVHQVSGLAPTMPLVFIRSAAASPTAAQLSMDLHDVSSGQLLRDNLEVKETGRHRLSLLKCLSMSPQEVEEAFLRGNKPRQRRSFGMAAFMALLFTLTVLVMDGAAIPGGGQTLPWKIVITAIALVISVLVFKLQPLRSLTWSYDLFCCVLVASQAAVAFWQPGYPPRGPSVTRYYAAEEALFFVFSFFYGSLRLKWSFVVNILLVIIYHVVFATDRELLATIPANLVFLVPLWLAGFAGVYQMEKMTRFDFVLTQILEDRRMRMKEARDKSEQLLLNIIPEQILSSLNGDITTFAKRYENTTIMFIKAEGFIQGAESLEPPDLIAMLNHTFVRFDEICALHNIEKIKMIGPVYMAAAGLPTANERHARHVVQAALEIMTALPRINAELDEAQEALNIKPEFRLRTHLRVGIHSGPVVGGIIGSLKTLFDVWGDTVNTASRMQSHCPIDAIQISKATYDHIKGNAHEYCHLSELQTIEVKGKGPMQTALVIPIASTEKN